MFKASAIAFASLLIVACGGQSTPDLAKAAEPSPRGRVVVDVSKIAGKSQSDTSALLGAPVSCELVTYGEKCFYRTGNTEIVFISGKADWITVGALDGAPYSSDVLPLLGLKKMDASFSNEHTIRWEEIPGLLEVSIFPGQSGAGYAHIKTATR